MRVSTVAIFGQDRDQETEFPKRGLVINFVQDCLKPRGPQYLPACDQGRRGGGHQGPGVRTKTEPHQEHLGCFLTMRGLSLKTRGGFGVVSLMVGRAAGKAGKVRFRVSGLCSASTSLEDMEGINEIETAREEFWRRLLIFRFLLCM